MFIYLVHLPLPSTAAWPLQDFLLYLAANNQQFERIRISCYLGRVLFSCDIAASLMNPTLAPGLRHGKRVLYKMVVREQGHDRPNRRTATVSWPDDYSPSGTQPTTYCRRQVSFGFEFDHALAGVEWPPGLESVVFGFRFNKPLDDAHWPAAISQLSLGESFNLPLQNVRCVRVLRYTEYVSGVKLSGIGGDHGGKISGSWCM